MMSHSPPLSVTKRQGTTTPVDLMVHSLKGICESDSGIDSLVSTLALFRITQPSDQEGKSGDNIVANSGTA